MTVVLAGAEHLQDVQTLAPDRDGTLHRDAQNVVEEVVDNPYRGLDAFSEEDADVFFGRDWEIDKAFHLVTALHRAPPGTDHTPRFFTLLGPSGSGKSSVLRAGLVPRIAKEPPSERLTRLLVTTPGSEPLFALAHSLAALKVPEIGVAHERERLELAQTYETLLRTSPDGTQKGLEKIAISQFPDEHLVIVFDQFEEIYALADRNERDRVIDNLLYATGPRGTVTVLASFRSDLLERTREHSELNRCMSREENHFIVPYMAPDALRAAIERPAQVRGHAFEPALVDLLVEEATGEAGSLPALQYTLAQLWNAMPQKSPSERWRELDGVGGALASRGGEILEQLTKEQFDIARRLFLATVVLTEDDSITRRRARVREIVADDEARDAVLTVLRFFSASDTRLLTVRGDAGYVDFTVAHETLFVKWQTLAQWIDHARDDLKLFRRIADAAAYWEENGQDPDLLWRGAELEQMRLLRDKPDYGALRFSRIQSLFSDECEAAAQAEAELRRRNRKLRRMAFSSFVALSFGLMIIAGKLVSVAYADWQELRPWGRLVDLDTGSQYLLRNRLVYVGRDVVATPQNAEVQNADTKAQLTPDVALPLRSVSRSHLLMTRQGDIQDMRSTYGTTVNGRQIFYSQAATFNSGDIIILGGQTAVRYEDIDYAWHEWLFPKALPPAEEACGWGVLVALKDGKASTHFLENYDIGLSLDADEVAVVAHDDPQALVTFRLVYDDPQLALVDDSKIAYLLKRAEGELTYTQWQRRINTEWWNLPDTDVYPFFGVTVTVNSFEKHVDAEFRTDAYELGKVRIPAGAEIVSAISKRTSEPRHTLVYPHFFSLVIGETRVQVVPFVNDLEWDPCEAT